MGALSFFNFPLHLYSEFEKNHFGLDFWEQCESFLTAPTVTLAVELLMASQPAGRQSVIQLLLCYSVSFLSSLLMSSTRGAKGTWQHPQGLHLVPSCHLGHGNSFRRGLQPCLLSVAVCVLAGAVQLMEYHLCCPCIAPLTGGEHLLEPVALY